MNAVRVERPAPYIVRPGKGDAPVSPCGRRCETHKPRDLKPWGGAA